MAARILSGQPLSLYRTAAGQSLRGQPLQRATASAYSTAGEPPQRIQSIDDVQFAPGQQLHGFTVDRVHSIPEFNCKAVTLTHEATNAKHLHVARLDPNNVFSVAFRTTPEDSRGVAHILEHTALCGSKKYPCRDPFFKMLTRSLATFMNAWTAQDWTMYPFSTTNQKDYQHLLSVYLDAVFFPNLAEHDFKQEGWRLENEITTDPESPLIFKGVVFNEMKGSLSSQDTFYAVEASRALHPECTYSHVSGGDPLAILDLTWEDLKDFHKLHYHPSNAHFYSYGDMPLESCLEAVHDKALNQFTTLPVDFTVQPGKRFNAPQKKYSHCPVDSMAPDQDKQTKVSVAWKLGDSTEPYDVFVMKIVSMLLVHGTDSVFFDSLMTNGGGIGSDFTPNTGYDNSTRDTTFGVGLKGVADHDVDEVEKMIIKTFERVAEEGFDPEAVKATLHEVEMSTKHQTTSFGINVAASLTSSWFHGADVITMLGIENLVTRFQEDIKDPAFLKNVIKKNFLDNTHRLTFVMQPDPEFQQKLDAQEQKMLEERVNLLTEEDKKALFDSGVDLMERQSKNQEQDVACLPTLGVHEISPAGVSHPLEQTQWKGEKATAALQIAKQPTNGLVYFRGLLDTAHVSNDDAIYLPLLGSVLTSLGTKAQSQSELAREIRMRTGGISYSQFASPDPTSVQNFNRGLKVGSSCLSRNTAGMFETLEKTFTSANFDNVSELATLTNMIASDMVSSIADSGHSFAVGAAASELMPLAHHQDRMGGLTQIQFIQQLVTEGNFEDVAKRLQSVAQSVLNLSNFRCGVNADEDAARIGIPAAHQFLSSLESSIERHDPQEVCVLEFNPAETSKKRFIESPFPISFAAKAFVTVPYTHEDSAALSILASILSSRYLHRAIREQGGAYGAGASESGGIFKFFSYRDPSPKKSQGAFDDSISWVSSTKISEQDISEAKLQIFQRVDEPVAPSQVGNAMLFNNITPEMQQERRKLLLEVTAEDVVRVAQKYLDPEQSVSSSVVFGGYNPKDELEGWEGWGASSNSHT